MNVLLLVVANWLLPVMVLAAGIWLFVIGCKYETDTADHQVLTLIGFAAVAFAVFLGITMPEPDLFNPLKMLWAELINGTELARNMIGVLLVLTVSALMMPVRQGVLPVLCVHIEHRWIEGAASAMSLICPPIAACYAVCHWCL